MYDHIKNALSETLDDWDMMQKTDGEEGADWAECFERHFYIFVEALKKWFSGLENPPQDLEEAKKMPEIFNLESQLPAPLALNFITELKNIIDGVELSRYD